MTQPTPRPGHVLSFRAPDLTPGYADCLNCGRRIERLEWATTTCPGKPTDERRDG